MSDKNQERVAQGKKVRDICHEKFRQLDRTTHSDLFEFSELAGQFLAQTEKPTELKLSTFLKYQEIFRPDKERLQTDDDYRRRIAGLSREYQKDIINPFYPVFIVDDKTGDLVGIHDRLMPRVGSTGMDYTSLAHREKNYLGPNSRDPEGIIAQRDTISDFLLTHDSKDFEKQVATWRIEASMVIYLQQKLEADRKRKAGEKVDTPSTTQQTQKPKTPSVEQDMDFI